MKSLTLLRHAKSGWDDAVARDFDRPLNAKGKRAAAMMGRHMKALALEFDRAVASPARRVEETLAEVSAGYGRVIAPEWDRRLYLASAASILELAREQDAGVSRLLVIGHNPGLEDLVLTLAPDDGNALRDAAEEKYPTATLAELTFDGEWTSLAAGRATLIRFVRPRDLDPSLGPDAD